MLRISIHDDELAATLKLEGKVIGPWARELSRVWSELKPSLGVKKLCLDLCGVTLVDQSGTRILQQILRGTGAEILADTPLARYFAAQTMRTMPQNEKKEKLVCPPARRPKSFPIAGPAR
jgi:ABC-type transporter Mla MlaB component